MNQMVESDLPSSLLSFNQPVRTDRLLRAGALYLMAGLIGWISLAAELSSLDLLSSSNRVFQRF